MRLSTLCFVPVGLALLCGCSDPVPPTPRGAVTVSFVDSGIDCAHAGHNMQIGQVGPDNKDAVVVDGTDNARIECQVSDVGGKFDVSASASQGDKALSIVVNGITAGATEEAPMPGGISYVSANTVDAYLTSKENPCNFYFIPPRQGIASGRIWAAFKCPKVESEGSVCQIAQGYVIFENCNE
jgi:hypothetical protein